MGQATDQKVGEIERTRAQLEADLRELEERMPPILRSGKRVVGLVVSGGVASAAVLAALRRRKHKREQARQNPEVTVRILTDRSAVATRSR
jgi:asparagine synthetase B (glutamine-hydrolysing)